MPTLMFQSWNGKGPRHQFSVVMYTHTRARAARTRTHTHTHAHTHTHVKTALHCTSRSGGQGRLPGGFLCLSNRSKVAVINSISAADREDPVHRSNRSLDDRPIHRAGRVACSAPCIQSGAHMNVCVCGGGGGGGGGSERQKVCARV